MNTPRAAQLRIGPPDRAPPLWPGGPHTVPTDTPHHLGVSETSRTDRARKPLNRNIIDSQALDLVQLFG